jgi:hypothetical protein
MLGEKSFLNLFGKIVLFPVLLFGCVLMSVLILLFEK